MFNPKEIKRAKDLLERGYHVVAIEFDNINSVINCSDDVIRTINEASRLKPIDCEYWVVKCRTQNNPIRERKRKKITCELPPVQYICKRSVIQL